MEQTTKMSNYPNRPGYKTETPSTSKEAAARMETSATKLRMRVLRMIQSRRDGVTADECAALLGESILSVRPRLSELNKLGSIEATGQRRPSSTGSASAVWRMKTDGQQQLL